MGKHSTPRSARHRQRQRRDIEYLRRSSSKWVEGKQVRRPYRRQRQRRSILDLLFLPPFLIMDEIVERLRDWLNVS